MNRRIQNPLIVNFYQPTDNISECSVEGRRMFVPLKVNWNNFITTLNNRQGHDSILVQVDKSIDLDQPGTVNTINIKINQLIKLADGQIPVFTTDGTKDATYYFMNPSYDDQKTADGYAPSNDTVLAKYNSFENEDEWQRHQSQIWARMTDMMPLSTSDKFGPNHLAALTNETRGLEKKDVSRFFSYKSNKMLSPSLMGDDMIGMPSIDAKEYDGFTIVTKNAEGELVEKHQPVKSLKTIGKSGFAIPMGNLNGDIPKYQIAADISKINVELKAKAADGISFKRSEYCDKNGTYTFKLSDGKDSQLKVTKADPSTNEVTFTDVNGSFTVKLKDDILSTLKDRGYQIYEGVASLKVIPSSKYIWPSRGTMVGSTDEVAKTVTPSNPGFIVARPPKNESEKYTVIIAEGALKGHIVAKYVDVADRNGEVFGNIVTVDDGIIIAQVPGVARAFVEGVKPVYNKYPINKTIIAMDADGRDNKQVAQGINAAYDCLKEATDNVQVMSWDPKQKGLDDALLAVAQGKITFTELDITFGTADELFPLSKAVNKFPYLFDGTQATRSEWQTEYTAHKEQKNAEIQKMQEDSANRQPKATDEATTVDNTPKPIDDAVTTNDSAKSIEANEKSIEANKTGGTTLTPEKRQKIIERMTKLQDQAKDLTNNLAILQTLLGDGGDTL